MDHRPISAPAAALLPFAAFVLAAPAHTTPPSTLLQPTAVCQKAQGFATQDPAANLRSRRAPAQEQVLFQDRDLDGNPWAVGATWKAGFDGRGFQFIPNFGPAAPKGFPVRMDLDSVQVGGDSLPIPTGRPTRQGNSVRTDRGSVVEVIDTDLRQIEQSFVFDSLPNRGTVRVEIAVNTELACAADADGLTFTHEFGTVTYRKAVAVDATGARLELPIRWTGREIHMEIPAQFVATAKLPLVLDPVLAANINVSVSAYPLQDGVDVATISSVDATCMTWFRVVNGSDKDSYAQLFDSNLSPISPVLPVDITTADVNNVSVAGLNHAQNFLIAAETRSLFTYFIAGNIVQANGTVGAPFVIERNGVVGLPGNNYRPCVGGDRYFSTAAYFAVVFEKLDPAVGNRDIYVRIVTRTGALLSAMPTVVANTPQDETRPSIGKSNGVAVNPYWAVSWQRTDPANPADEDLYGRYITYNGALHPTTFAVGTAPGPETNPAASSPIEINGQRFWLVAHEAGAVGSRDIFVKVFDANGVFTGALMNLDVAEGVSAYDRFAPHVDSDGVRFVVAYNEYRNGTTGDQETRATTIAYLPATNSLRREESRVPLGATPGHETHARVCSRASGGGWPGPNLIADVWTDPGVLTGLELYSFGGHRPTDAFTVVPMACGPLVMLPSGNPVCGGTVAFNVIAGPVSGTLFGFPGSTSLLPFGCNCTIGVSNPLSLGSAMVWNVPLDPVYVGITLAVQGWSGTGSSCLGAIDLSDTVRFTIR